MNEKRDHWIENKNQFLNLNLKKFVLSTNLTKNPDGILFI
jgi:hypothetical protein